MSLFNKLFGSEKPISMPDVFWNYLETLPELEEIDALSFTKPVVIFKHSTRCSISRMAWNQFQTEYQVPNEQMPLYYLDLLNYRDISNEIASRYAVHHQSPQVVVIKNGMAIYSASHESINAEIVARLAIEL